MSLNLSRERKRTARLCRTRDALAVLLHRATRRRVGDSLIVNIPVTFSPEFGEYDFQIVPLHRQHAQPRQDTRGRRSYPQGTIVPQIAS